MGADMLAGIVAHKKNAKIDFEAGHAFVKKLKPEDLDVNELVNQGLDEEEVYDDKMNVDYPYILTWLDNMVTEFSQTLNSREVTTASVRDLVLYIAGGMSWGDAPDACATFWQIGSVGGLLTSMGFVEDWDREEEVEVSPEEEAAAISSITSAAS